MTYFDGTNLKVSKFSSTFTELCNETIIATANMKSRYVKVDGILYIVIFKYKYKYNCIYKIWSFNILFYNNNRYI